MNWRITITFIFLLPLACSPPLKPLPELTPPGWADGETSVYEIVRGDSVLFQRVTTLSFDEELNEPILVVTNVVRSANAPFYFFDSTAFALTRFTLKPLWSYRVVATELSVSEAEAEYEPNQVRLRKETVEGSEEKTFKINQNFYPVEALSHLLRTIPLDPGLSFSVLVVVPMEFRTLRIEVVVLGTKLLATPLGDILCREVSAVAPRRRLRLFYELADPRRLVAIRDLENQTETRLVNFSVPPVVDSLLPLP